MNRIGLVLLNISVALYLFANGILGFTNDGGEFGTMVTTIFGHQDYTGIITIVLSICAIAAGILLLFGLFQMRVPITGVILIVFIVIWLIFIVIIDIINPITRENSLFRSNILMYLKQLAAHLLVLGSLFASAKISVR